MMNTPLRQLKAARKLLTKPEHWTQGSYAKGPQGETRSLREPGVVCWCLKGALLHVRDGHETIMDAVLELEATMNSDYMSVIEYNDYITRTHEDILNLLDETINRLEENETNR